MKILNNGQKEQIFAISSKFHINTSLAVPGALAHCLQRLQNPKWPPGGPKMAEGVWKGFWCSKQLLLNKFFGLSTPSMRKGNSGEQRKRRVEESEKRLMRVVSTMSLSAVDRPNADRWNAAHSCQLIKTFNG